jgi:hypothetical protein
MSVEEQVQSPAFGLHNKPQELWMLADRETGHFILAIDCAGEPLLAYTSWDDAIRGADAHENLWNIDCEPVRVQ